MQTHFEVLRDGLRGPSNGRRRRETDREVLRQEREVLRQEREVLRQEREVLRQEREVLRQEREVLRQEREVLRQEREVLRHDREVLRHDREVLLQDRDGGRRGAPFLETRFEVPRVGRQRLRDDRDVLSQSLAILSQYLAILSQYLAILSQYLAILSQYLAAASQYLAAPSQHLTVPANCPAARSQEVVVASKCLSDVRLSTSDGSPPGRSVPGAGSVFESPNRGLRVGPRLGPGSALQGRWRCGIQRRNRGAGGPGNPAPRSPGGIEVAERPGRDLHVRPLCRCQALRDGKERLSPMRLLSLVVPLALSVLDAASVQAATGAGPEPPVVTTPAPVGTLTLRWRVAGTTRPSVCDAYAATTLELVIYDAGGNRMATEYAPCASFALTLALPDGTYSAEATLVDPHANARSVTRQLAAIEVVSRSDLAVDLDFPPRSIL